jgi:outer membrane protein OmpA-like peptidoglycan-associated protein
MREFRENETTTTGPAASADTMSVGKTPLTAETPTPGGGSNPATPGANGATTTTGAPGAPGAMSAQEKEQKKKFRARNDLHLTDHIPSTGIGKFDASYKPKSGVMAVKVKLHFDFVQADNTPSTADPKKKGDAKYFWTSTQKNQYIKGFISQVSKRWTAKHVMHSTKPQWTEFSAEPHVTPVKTKDKANAHFAVTVHKSPGPGIDYKSGVNNEHLINPSAQPTADFWQSDNRREPNFNSTSVAHNERTRLEAALTAANADRIVFDPGKAELSGAAAGHLAGFAKRANEANPSAPMIPIHVEGTASAPTTGSDIKAQSKLAKDRAAAVVAALKKAGIRQPVTGKGSAPSGTQDHATVSIDTSFESAYKSNRYSVSEHEFGHMLGNPDEYANSTTGPLGGMQSKWTALVQSAGLSVPTFGEDTSSQMADGVDVLPQHYITLWEALGKMTTPDIKQDEWSLK